MSTIHKKKSAVSFEKKIQQHQKKEQQKQEEELKKEEARNIEDELESASDPRVVKHYEEAAQVTNEALKLAESLCKDGAVVFDVCQQVNKFIEEECSKLFQNEFSYEKGISFPCSISLNNCCGYFCPLKDDKTVMKKGDVAKIDIGSHISGFVAEACKTIVIDEEPSGEKKNLLEASYMCLQNVLEHLKADVETSELTKIIDETCQKYNVKAFENIVSKNMERYVIDGTKFILNVPSKTQIEKMTIELHDVWNLDIMLTSGPAKPIEKDKRTTIYKRNMDEMYILKMKTSLQVFREINSKYPAFPFSLGMLENESKAKMGIVEMVKHDLVDPYTVVFDKSGFVAQLKATVIVTENGPKVLTPIEMPAFLKKD